MKSFDYIKKYKSNLNFNVLKRLFADDGIELTDEVIAYLKKTPWNTNLNMLRSLVGSGGGASDNALTNENEIELTDENGNVIEIS